MATSKNKKPVTVNNAKGKTVYDPNKRTITTYNKKGKTVEDKKRDFTTTYNKKGSTVTIGGLPDTSVVQNKKGKTVNYSDGSVDTYNKKGSQIKNKDGSVTTRNSKGITTIPPAKKETTKTPAKPKTDSKKAIPASDSRYKNMTPAERNANTLKNVKESIGSTKKTDVKKPADTKKPVTVVNAKGKTTYDPKARTVTTYNSKGKTVEDKKNNKTTTYNKKGKTTVGTEGKEVENKKGSRFVANYKGLGKQVTVRDKKGTRFYGDDKLLTENTKEGTKFYYSDGTGTLINSKGSKAIPPAKKETNLPEVKVTPPKKTTPASNNTSIEQKAKDAMSGKYGTGAARKTALGADYDKVQAIINKKATATKAKPTGPSKGTVATMQKNIKDEQEGRLKFDEPVASVSTKSTEVKPEVKPAAVDVDKSIDAAMKGIAKSKIMKKGGTVKMKYSGSMKTKKR